MSSAGLRLLMVLCALAGVKGCKLLNEHQPTTVRVSLLGPFKDEYLTETDRLLAAAEEFLDCGQVAKAERALDKALILNPHLGPVHNNLGLIYFDRRQLYDAAHAFNRAMELMPDDPLPEYNLALTLEAGSRLNEAIYHFEQAHRADPDNPIFLGSLLRARVARGDITDDVVDLLQRLVFLDSRPDWVEWARDELEIMLPKARRGAELELEELRQREEQTPASEEDPDQPPEEGPQLQTPPVPPVPPEIEAAGTVSLDDVSREPSSESTTLFGSDPVDGTPFTTGDPPSEWPVLQLPLYQHKGAGDAQLPAGDSR